MKERSWRGSARCRNWNGSCIGGGVEPGHDRLGAVVAERLLEQLRGRTAQAALGDVGPGGRQVAELREHRLGLVGLERLQLERSRRRSPRPRPRGRCVSTLGGAARWPSWTSRMAALRTPHSFEVVRSCQRSAPPASRAAAAATSSGWRSTSAAISSRGRHPAARPGGLQRERGGAGSRAAARPRRRRGVAAQLLDDVRRGLVAQLAALAAAEPGQRAARQRRRRRCRRCGSSRHLAALASAASAAASAAAAAFSGGAVERHRGDRRRCRRAWGRCRARR